MSIPSSAAIYSLPSTDGNQQFTDTPLPEFNKIKLQEINIYSTHTAASKPQITGSDKMTKNKRYTEFSLLQPQNQQSFYNQPSITIQIQLQPKLQPGDYIELWLDGQALPSITTNKTNLKNPDPGEHQLQAKLMSASKEVLMTTEIIYIYIHRSTVDAN